MAEDCSWLSAFLVLYSIIPSNTCTLLYIVRNYMLASKQYYGLCPQLADGFINTVYKRYMPYINNICTGVGTGCVFFT